MAGQGLTTPWPATPPHQPNTGRGRAPASSLDTGQQIDIDKSLERIHRTDRAKVDLSNTLRESARVAWSLGDAVGAAAIDKMTALLDQCRGGRAYREAGCGVYLVRPRSCHVRLCPDCERSRSARFVMRLAELVGTMSRAVFWTLTIPNVARGRLVSGVDLLLDAFRALRRRAIFAGGPCPGHDCGHPRHRAALMAECRCARCVRCTKCIHQAVAGGVYSIEITWRPERGDWHPHLHALMDSPWVAWAEMRDAWRAVTCDAIRKAERKAAGTPGRLPRCAHPADERGIALAPCRGASIVWVEAVKGDGEARVKAIRETLKYVSKGLLDRDGKLVETAGPPELAELVLAIRTRRLVSGWGSFRNVHDQDDDGPDPDVLSGPDVAPELRGLPRTCPTCRMEAMWEMPINVPRRACLPGKDGWLIWRPPQAARA